jgi:hypothetical protein
VRWSSERVLHGERHGLRAALTRCRRFYLPRSPPSPAIVEVAQRSREIKRSAPRDANVACDALSVEISLRTYLQRPGSSRGDDAIAYGATRRAAVSRLSAACGALGGGASGGLLTSCLLVFSEIQCRSFHTYLLWGIEMTFHRCILKNVSPVHALYRLTFGILVSGLTTLQGRRELAVLSMIAFHLA